MHEIAIVFSCFCAKHTLFSMKFITFVPCFARNITFYLLNFLFEFAPHTRESEQNQIYLEYAISANFNHSRFGGRAKPEQEYGWGCAILL